MINACHYRFLWFLVCIPAIALANTPTASHTQQQLNHISTQIGHLQTMLAQTQTKRQKHEHKLTSLEKQINEQTRALKTIQINIDKKQQDIQHIQEDIEASSQKLLTQQQTLTAHLRARYHMGQISTLQWLINQNNLTSFEHLTTYTQYIIRVDQRLIQDIQATTATLNAHQAQLKFEFANIQKLQQTLITQQRTLTTIRQQHCQMIATLTQSIQKKQQLLEHYQQDQVKLQALFNQLSTTSSLVARLSSTFIRFRGKLANPLNQKDAPTKSMNQGILFLAHEGAPVSAVMPGKVVFSDWLNGYGLLIIIDHGQGMMSLYAHNKSLYKTKGSIVKQGDRIASVGHTGGLQENGLYFELRRRGKVVPPRQWVA